MSDSCFLCVRPSFTEGAARVFDFAGTLNEYNRSMTPEQADHLALLQDWRLIGGDIQAAMLAVLEKPQERQENQG